MGVFVQLYIVPGRIDPGAWAEMYDQTLEIIRKYPGTPAAGMNQEDLGFCTRLVYTRNLEHDVHLPDQRRWVVVGDMRSGTMAEDFTLYRDLSHYQRSQGPADKVREILAELCTRERAHVSTVFNSKTQGCPYHYSMLAVGMLIESRFSPYACVTGDINRDQAERVIREAGHLAGTPLRTPVCTVAEELLTRLAPFSQVKEHLNNASTLFRGNSRDLWRAMGALVDRKSLACHVKSMLRGYSSPGQAGVIRLMIDWLNATGDVEALASIMCIDPDGPSFSPEAFIGALVSTWITVSPEHFDFLRSLERPGDQADTVEDQLASMFTTIMFTGKEIELHLTTEELSEKAARVFPEQGKALAGIIEEETRKAVRQLEKQKRRIEKQRSPRAVTTLSDDEAFREESIKTMTTLRDKFTMLIEACRKKYIPYTGFPGREILWKHLVRQAEEQGITVREDAWAWIDREEDTGVLLFLLSMASIAFTSYDMVKVRIRIFEDREFCMMLLSLMKEDQDCNRPG